MSNKSSIDLLALVGAELISVEKNGRKVNWVCVPVDYKKNDPPADLTVCQTGTVIVEHGLSRISS